MTDQAPRNPRFTPFVAARRARAREVIGGILGLGLTDDWTWRPRSDGGLEVRLGTLALDLVPAAPEARGWLVGARWVLSYRRGPDGRDPLEHPDDRARLEAIRAAVELADRRPGPPGLPSAVAEAIALREVEDYMLRQARPRELVIRLGFRCNQDCWFCWQGRRWPGPPEPLYATWLAEAAAAGHRAVHFSGGEPTLHRGLADLVRAATRDHGMRAWLQTNAVLLAKPGAVDRLVDAGLVGAFVSYHAADPELSDRMTRAPGTWERTVRGVEACLAAGLAVELNCVVERANHDHLVAHAEDVVARFVAPFPDNPVSRVSYSHPHDYYERGAWEASHVALDLVRPHLVAAATRLLDAGVAVEGIGTCGFPPCLVGDQPALLRALSPRAEHAMDTSARAYAEVCDACAARSGCLGVRRETLARFGAAGLRPFERSPFPARESLRTRETPLGD